MLFGTAPSRFMKLIFSINNDYVVDMCLVFYEVGLFFFFGSLSTPVKTWNSAGSFDFQIENTLDFLVLRVNLQKIFRYTSSIF
jgi:hypothetical protein